MPIMQPTHEAPIPRLPVLGWSSFSRARAASLPGVLDARNHRYTISGRAAIALALRVLNVQPGYGVLVPTYHCPTMIAPIVQAGAVPVFYPITASGAPDLRWIEQADLRNVQAMLATHYFGLPQPMAEIRSFCLQNLIQLIEDCAHAFFGVSDGRPVGTWGDVSIASLTKFFPVPEGGIIASDTRSLQMLKLDARSLVEQVKAAADAVELGARHGRFPGLNPLLAALFGVKNRLRGRREGVELPQPAGAMSSSAHPGSVPLLSSSRPALAVRWIVDRVHRARIVELRRRNYLELARRLSDLPGARPLQPELPEGAVPYVFPLYVDHPALSYQALREAGVPVFRWDDVWPGTPGLAGDHGANWANHVFQLGCHQDLLARDMDAMVAKLRTILANAEARAAPITVRLGGREIVSSAKDTLQAAVSPSAGAPAGSASGAP